MIPRKASRHKEQQESPDPLRQRVIFCMECGETIENFCVSRNADDLEAVRKTLAQCRSNGRFNGEFCSKLFIAHPDALDDPEPKS